MIEKMTTKGGICNYPEGERSNRFGKKRCKRRERITQEVRSSSHNRIRGGVVVWKSGTGSSTRRASTHARRSVGRRGNGKGEYRRRKKGSIEVK